MKVGYKRHVFKFEKLVDRDDLSEIESLLKLGAKLIPVRTYYKWVGKKGKFEVTIEVELEWK
jgi:hypothetical protein